MPVSFGKNIILTNTAKIVNVGAVIFASFLEEQATEESDPHCLTFKFPLDGEN
ncbi:MAG: hypothetical protein MET45_12545 [Nostoc sp. LLA-1]|nr:hypothetical protein [Cyanocohniella sp. LLY]